MPTSTANRNRTDPAPAGPTPRRRPGPLLELAATKGLALARLARLADISASALYHNRALTPEEYARMKRVIAEVSR